MIIQKTKEILLFTTFLIVGLFILYKAAMHSHNHCKTVNSTIEDYRFCMNI